MVERQKQKYGWEFLLLGANIDAIEVVGRFGICANRAVKYECDRRGTEVNYRVLNEAVSISKINFIHFGGRWIGIGVLLNNLKKYIGWKMLRWSTDV